MLCVNLEADIGVIWVNFFLNVNFRFFIGNGKVGNLETNI